MKRPLKKTCAKRRLPREIKDLIRLRSECEAALAGATKAERRFGIATITVIDRIVRPNSEMERALDTMQNLAKMSDRSIAACPNYEVAG